MKYFSETIAESIITFHPIAHSLAVGVGVHRI